MRTATAVSSGSGALRRSGRATTWRSRGTLRVTVSYHPPRGRGPCVLPRVSKITLNSTHNFQKHFKKMQKVHHPHPGSNNPERPTPRLLLRLTGLYAEIDLWPFDHSPFNSTSETDNTSLERTERRAIRLASHLPRVQLMTSFKTNPHIPRPPEKYKV